MIKTKRTLRSAALGFAVADLASPGLAQKRKYHNTGGREDPTVTIFEISKIAFSPQFDMKRPNRPLTESCEFDIIDHSQNSPFR
jgi:hypothetical protein